jgi:hypothetical protein
MEDGMDYKIYHLDIIPNTQEIIDYLEKLYWENDGSTDLEKESAEGWFVPYVVMAEYADMNWPNHEHVMKEISVRFPNSRFDLYIQGHNFGDVWKKTFQDGIMRSYRARFSYDEVIEL